MASFKDREKRDWSVDITVGSIKRVADRLKINLYSLIDDKMAGFQELMANPVKLVDVVYVLCLPQAEAAKISDEDFGGSLCGESLNAMQEAFTTALIDFFPDRSQAATLRKMIAKAKEVAAIVQTNNGTAIDNLDANSLVESLKNPSGSLPALSA